MREAGWIGRGRNLPFYLVGGSWRALARLDMDRTGYLLPVVHQYPIALPRVGGRRRHGRNTSFAIDVSPKKRAP